MVYINDCVLRINSVSEPILLADDISVIISSINFEDFCSVSDLVLCHTIKWFADNSTVLSLDKFLQEKLYKMLCLLRVKCKCTLRHYVGLM
jgi:hypothetical protein